MNAATHDYEKTLSHRLALFLLVPLSIVLVGLVTTLFVNNTTAYIDGLSMEPQLKHNELVLVTRGYDNPRRGDVVVVLFESSDGSEQGVVKRIVGLPGDEIEIRQGRAIINGESERGDYTVYVAEGDIEAPRRTVPDDHLYVLGDNRPISEDSRLFGPVPIGAIEGQVTWVIAPVNVFRRVD